MKDDRLVEMRVFKAVVDAGGFTAAANALGVSQSKVSETVTALERRLAVQLLHRSTRGLRLTDEGERFLQSSSRILDDIEQAESDVASGTAAAAGDLRISVPLAFGMDQIVPLLPAFMARHPGITVHVSLSDALSHLIEDNIDVAVRMGQLRDSTLKARKLCDLERVVVAAPGYLEAHGTPRRPADLKDHNCLMWQAPHTHLNRWPFRTGDGTETVSVRGNLRSSDGLALYRLCVAGMGIMRCAEHLALPAVRTGALVPLLEEVRAPGDTAIHAVFLPEREVVPRIRAFVDFLAETFRTPPWLA